MPTPASSNPDRPFVYFHFQLLLVAASAILVGGSCPGSAYASAALTEWRSARATYYDPRDTVGGACGYGDLGKEGYGMGTAGLSEALFEREEACGGCYKVRCVEELRYCIPGTSIVLTATNFCAPSPRHCNHQKITIWKAGVMPIQYHRSRFCRGQLVFLFLQVIPRSLGTRILLLLSWRVFVLVIKVICMILGTMILLLMPWRVLAIVLQKRRRLKAIEEKLQHSNGEA